VNCRVHFRGVASSGLPAGVVDSPALRAGGLYAERAPFVPHRHHGVFLWHRQRPLHHAGHGGFPVLAVDFLRCLQLSQMVGRGGGAFAFGHYWSKLGHHGAVLCFRRCALSWDRRTAAAWRHADRGAGRDQRRANRSLRGLGWRQAPVCPPPDHRGLGSGGTCRKRAPVLV